MFEKIEKLIDDGLLTKELVYDEITRYLGTEKLNEFAEFFCRMHDINFDEEEYRDE